MIFFGFFLFSLGLIFGSFLNSLIFRIDQKKPLPKRSFCPKCKNKILWYDNIPLISYLLLKGDCRSCKKKISLEYPLVEMLCGAIFLAAGVFSAPGKVIYTWINSIINPLLSHAGFAQIDYFGINESLGSAINFPILATLSLFFLLIVCFLMLAVAIYDAKTKYILSMYVYAGIFFSFSYNLSEYFRLNSEWQVTSIFIYLFPFLLAGLIPATFFWLASKISKEKIMGAGDAEIALLMGILLGWPKVIPAYFIAFLVAGAWGSYLLITKKAKMKSEVPLGPFLILGVFFSLLFGEQIIAWYVKMFLVI